MIEATVSVECEDIDAVGVASGGGRLAREAPAERFPLVPALTVPVAIANIAIVVDGEELALSAITPRRDGRAPLERSAQGDPVAYLLRPTFFSHPFATSLGSILSTSTCLFMAVSSAVVSFGAMELMSVLKLSPAFDR